jgi:hypothetical protein
LEGLFESRSDPDAEPDEPASEDDEPEDDEPEDDESEDDEPEVAPASSRLPREEDFDPERLSVA